MSVDRIFKYIIMCLGLVVTFTTTAQQGSNPFEIIRAKESNVADTIPTQATNNAQRPNGNNHGNVFEVYREDDDSADRTVTTTRDSAASIITKTLGDAESDEVDIDDDNMDYISDNPFEVSHIPYRRSELKEQASKSTAVTSSNNSNIRSIVNVKSTSNTFIFWLVLFTLLLLAIVVNVQRSALSKVAKSITNENVLKLSKREENGGLSGHYIMMYVMFFINLTCFLYLVAKSFNGLDGFSNWLLVFGGVVVTYMIRHISMSFIGNIFDVSKDSTLYSFTIMTFNIFLGLVLIPVNLVVAFSPPEISSLAMYLGIGLILILLLIRWVRGLLIGVRFIGEHLFQFFLYLCTFEIAPILILLRILGDQ